MACLVLQGQINTNTVAWNHLDYCLLHTANCITCGNNSSEVQERPVTVSVLKAMAAKGIEQCHLLLLC